MSKYCLLYVSELPRQRIFKEHKFRDPQELSIEVDAVLRAYFYREFGDGLFREREPSYFVGEILGLPTLDTNPDIFPQNLARFKEQLSIRKPRQIASLPTSRIKEYLSEDPLLDFAARRLVLTYCIDPILDKEELDPTGLVFGVVELHSPSRRQMEDLEALMRGIDMSKLATTHRMA